MSIQSNINQAISLAGFLASQSPGVKIRQEGLRIQGKQEQAIAGLADIDKNLRRADLTSRMSTLTDEEKKELESLGGPKEYNKKEYENIKNRADEYQNAIYDAKSAALNPKYRGIIKPDLIRQQDLSSQLTRIHEGIESGKKALSPTSEGQTSITSEQQPKARGASSFAEFEESELTQGLPLGFNAPRETIRYEEGINNPQSDGSTNLLSERELSRFVRKPRRKLQMAEEARQSAAEAQQVRSEGQQASSEFARMITEGIPLGFNSPRETIRYGGNN